MSVPLSGDSPSQTTDCQYLDSDISPTLKPSMCGCNIFITPLKSAGLQQLKEFVSWFFGTKRLSLTCISYFLVKIYVKAENRTKTSQAAPYYSTCHHNKPPDPVVFVASLQVGFGCSEHGLSLFFSWVRWPFLPQTQLQAPLWCKWTATLSSQHLSLNSPFWCAFTLLSWTTTCVTSAQSLPVTVALLIGDLKYNVFVSRKSTRISI